MSMTSQPHALCIIDGDYAVRPFEHLAPHILAVHVDEHEAQRALERVTAMHQAVQVAASAVFDREAGLRQGIVALPLTAVHSDIAEPNLRSSCQHVADMANKYIVAFAAIGMPKGNKT